MGSYTGLQKTTDGGSSWTTQSYAIGPMDWIFDLQFIDANNGWAVGGNWDSWDNGFILHTSDGGDTWNTQYTSPTYMFDAISFVDANNGWAVGADDVDQDVIMHTSDGGITWINQSSGLTAFLSDVHFVNASSGWATTRFDVIKTIDGGNSWAFETLPGLSGDQLKAVYFLNANKGWVVGEEARILHIQNGGGIPTGIVEQAVQSVIEVYPNPTSGRFVLELQSTEMEKIDITILNILGQEVRTITARGLVTGKNIIEIDMLTYPSGLYNLLVRNKQGVISKKIIVE